MARSTSKRDVASKPKRDITLTVKSPEEGHRALASAVVDPAVMAARIVMGAATREDADRIDVPTLLSVLRDQAAAIQTGGTASLEPLLAGQVVALQALSVRLLTLGMAQETTANLEALIRLGLKAQSQSRQTAETLALLRNPPLVIARQANIATGPQQINNSIAREIPIAQNKLLEAEHERMDPGAQGAAGRIDPQLATLEPIDRTQDIRGQG